MQTSTRWWLGGGGGGTCQPTFDRPSAANSGAAAAFPSFRIGAVPQAATIFRVQFFSSSFRSKVFFVAAYPNYRIMEERRHLAALSSAAGNPQVGATGEGHHTLPTQPRAPTPPSSRNSMARGSGEDRPTDRDRLGLCSWANGASMVSIPPPPRSRRPSHRSAQFLETESHSRRSPRNVQRRPPSMD